MLALEAFLATVDALLESGQEVVIGGGLIRHAARASMAYPGWLPPFVKDGRTLIDGATLDPVPRWPRREFDEIVDAGTRAAEAKLPAILSSQARAIASARP